MDRQRFGIGTPGRCPVANMVRSRPFQRLPFRLANLLESFRANSRTREALKPLFSSPTLTDPEKANASQSELKDIDPPAPAKSSARDLVTIIEPPTGWLSLNLKEVWCYR